MKKRHGGQGRALMLDRRGVAASEFALIAPVLVLLMVSMVDLANAMWRTSRLEMAARAGAQYAFARPEDAAGITARVLGQLTGWTGVSVAPTTMVCKCDDGVAADCTTGSCPVGTIVHAPIGYISITVTQPFRYVSPISQAILPRLATLRGNVEMRLH
jgi:hypothetical protein